MTHTTNTLKLVELGQTPMFESFRFVVDEITHTTWYMGDEGKVMQHVLDADELREWMQEGILRITSANSDIWDEADEYGKASNTDDWDECDKVFVITRFVTKSLEKGRTAETAQSVQNVWYQYRRGMLTLSDVSNMLLSLPIK